MGLGGSLLRADHRPLIPSGRRFRRFGQLVIKSISDGQRGSLGRPAPPRSFLTQRLT